MICVSDILHTQKAITPFWLFINHPPVSQNYRIKLNRIKKKLKYQNVTILQDKVCKGCT
jgi:hypothetical protein